MKFVSRLWACLRLFVKFNKVTIQLMYGTWRITGLSQPTVSIFGGSRFEQTDRYTLQARALAERLVQNGISLLTGGGPGIMEAVTCGAIEKNISNQVRSMGIGVRGLDPGKRPCAQEYFELDYFFARKWLLTHYSVGFIVFPGGFGTLDELGEILTLLQTRMINPIPIVLIGKEYWKDFMSWIYNEALKHKLISEVDLSLFTVTDDLDEVFTVIYQQSYQKKREL